MQNRHRGASSFATQKVPLRYLDIALSHPPHPCGIRFDRPTKLRYIGDQRQGGVYGLGVARKGFIVGRKLRAIRRPPDEVRPCGASCLSTLPAESINRDLVIKVTRWSTRRLQSCESGR